MISFKTIQRRQSGEHIEWCQLAEAAGGEIVYHVPDNGLLVYKLQLVIGTEELLNDMLALCRRKGDVVWIAGALCSKVEFRFISSMLWLMNRISQKWFVHCQQQRELLETIGIKSTLIPINEVAYRGDVQPLPRTVLYTGYYWHEKQLGLFCDVARKMPTWKFVCHIPVDQPAPLERPPDNVTIDNRFRQHGEYMEFLASHDMIWIPRSESQWIYVGRSGVSAVLSGRPTLLPDVAQNENIPGDACIKYHARLNADELVNLIETHPTPEFSAVRRFAEASSPQNVWRLINASPCQV